MKTLGIIIGVVMLCLTGLLGYNIAKTQEADLGEARESNIFRIDDDGNVLTTSHVVGTKFEDATAITATPANLGDMVSDTYYFKTTSVDDDGGETLPTDELSCIVNK